MSEEEKEQTAPFAKLKAAQQALVDVAMNWPRRYPSEVPANPNNYPPPPMPKVFEPIPYGEKTPLPDPGTEAERLARRNNTDKRKERRLGIRKSRQPVLSWLALRQSPKMTVEEQLLDVVNHYIVVEDMCSGTYAGSFLPLSGRTPQEAMALAREAMIRRLDKDEKRRLNGPKSKGKDAIVKP